MMLKSITTDFYSIRMDVHTDDSRGELWVSVKVHENNKLYNTENFPGNKYKDALEYFNRRESELKAAYGK